MAFASLRLHAVTSCIDDIFLTYMIYDSIVMPLASIPRDLRPTASSLSPICFMLGGCSLRVDTCQVEAQTRLLHQYKSAHVIIWP